MNNVSIREAMYWLARMAAADGVVSPSERSLLSEFANTFGLDESEILRWAYGFAKGVEVPDVEIVDPRVMKGLLFEKFVVSLLGDNCRLLSWRGDKIEGKTYAIENLYPDLKVKHILDASEVEYFVECKYRSTLNEEGLDLTQQFYRYLFHAKEQGLELFIALGVGGSPSCPDELFLVPGRMVKKDRMIDRTRFVKCLCGKTREDYHHYVNHYYNRRVFKR